MSVYFKLIHNKIFNIAHVESTYVTYNGSNRIRIQSYLFFTIPTICQNEDSSSLLFLEFDSGGIFELMIPKKKRKIAEHSKAGSTQRGTKLCLNLSDDTRKYIASQDFSFCCNLSRLM